MAWKYFVKRICSQNQESEMNIVCEYELGDKFTNIYRSFYLVDAKKNNEKSVKKG